MFYNSKSQDKTFIHKRFYAACFFIIVANFASAQIVSRDMQSRYCEYDSYGHLIKDENGAKINYPQEAFVGLVENSQTDPEPVLDEIKLDIADFENCQPDWQFSIIGDYPGKRTMATYDFDQDGLEEIICGARPVGGSGEWSYWYYLKFNLETEKYEIKWASNPYNDYMNRLIVFDTNDDGKKEILVGFDSGIVRIFDSETLLQISEFAVPTSSLNDINIGDADNDGLSEIVVSDNTKLYFYSSLTNAYEGSIVYGAFDFELGNVDDDAEIEIVTSQGWVLCYNSVAVTAEWLYMSGATSDYQCMLFLSDFDSDGKDEIIRSRSWDFIDVFDGDTQALKYSLDADADLDLIYLADVTGDGVDELIVGDGQWGDIRCYNANTAALIWTVENPEHGVSGLCVGNFDDDTSKEICWGSGWSSSGEDVIFVADVNQELIQWQSLTLDGPFYAIEIADIDNDYVNELVFVSYASESGYGSGIISVFDARSHELEWQSDGSFLDNIWTGVYNLSLEDIDNDENVEIIISAGEYYDAKIWIIDGTTKTIESSYDFGSSLDYFTSGDVADLDGDGVKEIIAINADGTYIINPSNFGSEWFSPGAGATLSRVIRCGNVDNDPNMELVVCTGIISVYDGVTHSQWQSINSNYVSLHLVDVNNDDILDIVAGTSNGDIEVFDVINQVLLSDFNVSSQAIDGIAVDDIDNDGQLEYIYTTQGRLCIYYDSENHVQTQQFGSVVGKINSLIVFDADENGDNEIYLGTPTGIIQIGQTTDPCVGFEYSYNLSNATCNEPADGYISIETSGGTEPYSYIWSNGALTPLNDNLQGGTYGVTISDYSGCFLTGSFIISQSYLSAQIYSSSESCVPGNDGEVWTNVTHGTQPFSYLWNDSSTESSLENVQAGTYYLTITDFNNCVVELSKIVSKDTLKVSGSSYNSSCFNNPNGSALVSIISGHSPYTYNWSNGISTSNAFGLSAGDYAVTITDNSGCTAVKQFVITSPSEIVTTVTTTNDNPETPFGEGTATINAYGGEPPYSISWNDAFEQTGITAINLVWGEYIATLVDDNNCTVQQIAIVDTLLTQVEIDSVEMLCSIYPNPTSEIVTIELPESYLPATCKLYNATGQIIETIEVINVTNVINIADYASGMYLMRITSSSEKIWVGSFSKE